MYIYIYICRYIYYVLKQYKTLSNKQNHPEPLWHMQDENISTNFQMKCLFPISRRSQTSSFSEPFRTPCSQLSSFLELFRIPCCFVKA